MANTHGRATALTVMTPLKRWGLGPLRLNFLLIEHVPAITGTLRRLRLIHFARWSILDRLPDDGQPPERLRYRYLFFQSNFNGSWSEYIDAFSYLLPVRMRGVWGTSFGFPGAQPVGPFKAYIRRNEYVASHFYSAYPKATTRTVLSALELERKFRAFQAQTRDLGPEAFQAAYRRFLTHAQRQL